VKTLWLMAVLAVTLALPAWGFLGDKEPDLVKRFGKPISRTGNTLAWNQDGLVIRATLDAGGKCIALRYSANNVELALREARLQEGMKRNAQTSEWLGQKEDDPHAPANAPPRKYLRKDGKAIAIRTAPAIIDILDLEAYDETGQLRTSPRPRE